MDKAEQILKADSQLAQQVSAGEVKLEPAFRQLERRYDDSDPYEQEYQGIRKDIARLHRAVLITLPEMRTKCMENLDGPEAQRMLRALKDLVADTEELLDYAQAQGVLTSKDSGRADG